MIMHGTLPIPSIKNVLFDFDGVIADTEAVFAVFDCGLLNDVLQELSLEPLLTPAYIRTLAGKNDDQKLLHIATEYDFDPQPLVSAYLEKRTELRQTLFLDNKVELSDGLRGFMAQHQGHYALATNKNRSKVSTDMTHMGIFKDFEDIIFCQENGLRKKPEPDILLHAVKQSGFTPETTAYIGDNDIDMIAANAAGLIPVGFIIERDNGDYSQRVEGLKKAGAAMVINSMDDLAALMKQEAT